MDGERFDRWTRSLAAPASRRGFIRGLGGGLAGGTLALIGRAAATAQTPPVIEPVKSPVIVLPHQSGCRQCSPDRTCVCHSGLGPNPVCQCVCRGNLIEAPLSDGCYCPATQVCGEACCAADETCCDGTCTQLGLDRDHCGAWDELVPRPRIVRMAHASAGTTS